MSSKISISAREIISALEALPPLSPRNLPENALERAQALLAQRPAPAKYPRAILYRYGAGQDYQEQVQAGGLPMHGVASALNMEVQLIELGSGAVNAEDNARAAAFGMMAAEEDTGLVVVAGFGDAAAIDPARFFETANPAAAAIFGAMIAGARAGIPVIAEGPQAFAAAQALYAVRPDFCDVVLICGVDDTARDARFTIFADADNDSAGAGDAGIMLAALLLAPKGEQQVA